jgi:hypothetical protein
MLALARAGAHSTSCGSGALAVRFMTVVTVIGRRPRRGGDDTMARQPGADPALVETQAQARRLLGPLAGGGSPSAHE